MVDAVRLSVICFVNAFAVCSVVPVKDEKKTRICIFCMRKLLSSWNGIRFFTPPTIRRGAFTITLLVTSGAFSFSGIRAGEEGGGDIESFS